jgi:hypothetical protein
MKELNPPAAVRPAEDVDARAINAEHEQGQKAQRQSLEHYRRCGELLARKKASLKHGQWGKWLAKNCPKVGDRQARRYMEFAKADVTSDLEAEWRRICGNVPQDDQEATGGQDEPEPTDDTDDAGPTDEAEPTDDTTANDTDDDDTDDAGQGGEQHDQHDQGGGQPGQGGQDDGAQDEGGKDDQGKDDDQDKDGPAPPDPKAQGQRMEAHLHRLEKTTTAELKAMAAIPPLSNARSKMVAKRLAKLSRLLGAAAKAMRAAAEDAAGAKVAAAAEAATKGKKQKEATT